VDAAVRITPDTSASHLTSARYLYLGLRDIAAAQRELNAARPELQNDPEFLELSAVIRRRLGDWTGAIADGEKVADLDPREPGRVFPLAESYIAVRRFSDAEAVADRAIAALPPQATEGFRLIKSTAAIGRGDLEAARTALEHVPYPTVEVRLQLAKLSILEHRFDEAARTLDQLIKEQPGASRFHSRRAVVARLMGDKERARSEFSQSCDLLRTLTAKGSEDSNVWLSLAVDEAAVGQKEASLQAAQRALQLAPPQHDAVDGPVAETWLAQVYAQLGQRDAAFDLLLRLSRAPCGPLLGELKFDPAWNNLRNDPRFTTVLRTAVLPPELPTRALD
jgi:tetratricopeptide (TPR) repeat protein